MKILAAVAAMVFFAVGVRAETTNDLSDAEIQGRNLARQLCDAQPTENFTNAGILQIRDREGNHTNIRVKFDTFVSSNSWSSRFNAVLTNKLEMEFQIYHKNNSRSIYVNNAQNTVVQTPLSDLEKYFPFADSDFYLADLGLEFFHWPEQKILKKEVKRSRGCSVLESTNPNPSTNGYSRVVSWIDNDGGGIVQAFAYDAQGKKLKEFYPKNIEKVNGQYQVQEMEMDNVQTGSRTRLEFDLNKQ
jgi:hypothetical protein